MIELFKLDTKGKKRSWKIEVSSDLGAYRVTSGLIDGKQVEGAWVFCEGKNVGRSNATWPAEQAMLEAQSIAQKKRDEGYRDSLDDVHLPKQFDCMLADRYKKWEGPCYSQPKLDGIRCNSMMGEVLMSRGHKEIVTCPHVLELLRPYTDAVIDGELYNHLFKDDFNEIASIVRRDKVDAEDLAKSERYAQFHVYDMFLPKHPSMPFSDRTAALEATVRQIGHPSIVYVPTALCETVDELDEVYAEYCADGYEGQMTRVPGSAYEQKRSKGLRKRKPLYEKGGHEEEWPIDAVEQGKGLWAGKAKVVVCRLPSGETSRATLKGNMKRAIELWARKDDLVGKLATVRFQNYTPDGKPRFPIAIDIDRGAY